MFIQTKINEVTTAVKAKLQSTATSVAIWTKRFALVGAVACTIAIGSAYAAVQSAMPHVHNIYSAAKLIDGEARGESYEGQQAVFGTILTRVADSRFPDTIHDVTYQPYSNNAKILQYNAMGDEFHEDLSTELGQKILWRTALWYTLDQLGWFYTPSEARGAHSYCTPNACKKQKGYFGTLKLIGQIGGHVFYGDCDCTSITVAENKNTAPETSVYPKARPEAVPQSEGTTFTLKRSLRPQARPAQSIVQQSSIEQAIEVAMKE